MTSEEYEKEIIAFLEKTKDMNDQKVKKILGDKIDELELHKLEYKKKELVEQFKKDIMKYYRDLRNFYIDKYSIYMEIFDDDESDLEFLNYRGTWTKKN